MSDFQQGDYITIEGSQIINGTFRVERVGYDTLNLRKVGNLRWFEWLSARIEDWFVYPIKNLLVRRDWGGAIAQVVEHLREMTHAD